MISENIILKKSPKIEFRIFERGFQLIDEHTKENSGFYAFNDLQSIELNNVWFPRLTKWLRIFSWVCNFVPLFPNAENCKSANVKFHFSNINLRMWLTDPYMADKAKTLKRLLDKRTQYED